MKSITVLKLKLEPTDEQDEHLLLAGRLCRKARNATLENWLLRQRGLPESEKQAKPSRKNIGEPLKESTKLYHAVTAAAPELDTQVASMIANGLDSQLKTKLDWRRQPGKQDGGEKPKKLRRSDAILNYDDRPPFFTKMEIPVRSVNAAFTFTEKPELAVTLLRGQRTSFTISTSRLKGGHKLFLHELANGIRKLSDSRIVERDGEWFWHVPFVFESEVRSDIEATISPVTDDKNDRPFKLELPCDRKWGIGDGRYLLGQTKRLIELRKQIGWRYQQRNGAGHGRQKIDEAMRKRSLQLANIVSEVRRRAIADTVQQCVRANVGRLIYREPSLPVREKCWFALKGLDWDWTRFIGDLKNSAARQGIEVIVQPLRMKELKSDDATHPEV